MIMFFFTFVSDCFRMKSESIRIDGFQWINGGFNKALFSKLIYPTSQFRHSAIQRQRMREKERAREREKKKELIWSAKRGGGGWGRGLARKRSKQNIVFLFVYSFYNILNCYKLFLFETFRKKLRGLFQRLSIWH